MNRRLVRRRNRFFRTYTRLRNGHRGEAIAELKALIDEAREANIQFEAMMATLKSREFAYRRQLLHNGSKP